MADPVYTIVAAMSENHVIGKKGEIPWHVRGDFIFWQDISRGKPVIMGRTTYEGMPPSFKKRDHIIIVTRDQNYQVDGSHVVHNLDDAFELAAEIARQKDIEEVIIGGGGEIYRQSINRVDRMYLSTIHTKVMGGDAEFPTFIKKKWDHANSEYFPPAPGDTCGFTLNLYTKK